MKKQPGLAPLGGERLRAFRRALPRILAARHDAFAADHRALDEQADWRRRAARLRPEGIARAGRKLGAPAAKERKALLTAARRAARASPSTLLIGGNRARYPPFEFADSQVEPSPLPGAVSPPVLFGPDATTGQVGAVIGLGESDEEAITVSSRSGVGFDVLTGLGTFVVIAQASIRGSVFVDTLSRGQYAEAYAGLRLSVGAGFSLPDDFIVEREFSTTTDIAYLSAGVGVLDSRSFGTTGNVDGDSRTVTLLATVERFRRRALRSLLISVEAIQTVTSDHATAGSQMEMFVGPVAVIPL